jgi:hypothetical protein
MEKHLLNILDGVMNKKYFYISVFFTMLSIITFCVGLFYGFTVELYFGKPITFFQYTAFLAFAFFINSIKERLEKSDKKDVYLIIGFFIAMVSFYEVLFNFFYWFSLYNFYGIGTDLDSLKNLIERQKFNVTYLFNMTNTEVLNRTGIYPVNLNLASKLVVLLFFCSVYWIYFMSNLNKKK